MKQSYINASWFAAGALLGAAVGYAIGDLRTSSSAAFPQRMALVVKHDTVVVPHPRPAKVKAVSVGRVTVAAPATDVVKLDSDSVAVTVPRLQQRYEGEGYVAWVSGASPALDSLRFVAPKVELELPGSLANAEPQRKPGRWHVGLSAGVAYTPAGWQPAVGLSLTFSLFSLSRR